MQSSLVYIPPIREPSSSTVISTTGPRGERRDGNGNGSSILSSSQTLDHYPHHHHHHHHDHHQQQRQPPPSPQQQQHLKGRDPDTDQEPDPISTAVAGAKGAPIVGESNPPLPPPPTNRNIANSSIRYLECLKNHAASIGGHVVDGCGEFMPMGKEGTLEALKCAVCNCHRNFHRKDVNGESQSGANFYYCYNPSNKINSGITKIVPSPPLQDHRKFPIGVSTSPLSGPIPPMVMAFGSGGVTESSSEELNMVAPMGVPSHPPPFATLSKKRYRTKFTQEQKDKMLEFAEKVGWRIQKQDETSVEQLCAEVGVKRRVLKVWMHNNKHSMKKKE